MKRGQITFFIILGLIILISIGLGLYYSGQFSKIQQAREIVEASKALEQSQDVQNFVEECILETTKNVIPTVLRNGGYYIPPRDSLIYMHYDIPLYMNNETENVPTLKTMSRQLASGINVMLPTCLGGFANLGEVELKGQSSTDVTISKSKIVVEVDLPLVIGEDVKSKLVRFYVEYKTNIVDVYDDSKNVYDQVKLYKGIVPISMVAFLAASNDYDFVSDNVGETQIYILRFNKTLIKKSPVEYTFAVYNPLKKGEHIMDGEDDLSLLFGLSFDDESSPT